MALEAVIAMAETAEEVDVDLERAEVVAEVGVAVLADVTMVLEATTVQQTTSTAEAVAVDQAEAAEHLEVTKAQAPAPGRSLPSVAIPSPLNPFLRSLLEARPSDREPLRLL